MQAEADVDDVVELAQVDAQELLDVRQALLQRVAVDVQHVGGLLDGEVVLEQRLEGLVEPGAVPGVVVEQRRERAPHDVGQGLLVESVEQPELPAQLVEQDGAAGGRVVTGRDAGGVSLLQAARSARQRR